MSVETIGHISGHCPRGKADRIKRHNMIVTSFKDHAIKPGFRVVMELLIVGRNGLHYKPDLLRSWGDKTIIADPMVVWDGDGELLKKAAKGKIE